MDDVRYCPKCEIEIRPARRLGPHLSGHLRAERAKYRYLDGDTHHPYEFKACRQCGTESWIQVRRDFCSRRCSRLGSNNPAWVGDRAKYIGRHVRVYQERGKATDHACEECDAPAKEWAQTHDTDGLDPEDYRPLCKSCHFRYDFPDRVGPQSHCKKGHLMHRSKSGKSWYCLECASARRKGGQ